MKAIINTKLILEDGIIFDGVITWENGKILQLGEQLYIHQTQHGNKTAQKNSHHQKQSN